MRIQNALLFFETSYSSADQNMSYKKISNLQYIKIKAGVGERGLISEWLIIRCLQVDGPSTGFGGGGGAYKWQFTVRRNQREDYVV